MPDARHRAVRHHSEGVAQCCALFDDLLVEGRIIPVRWIAEQHVIEDLGCIPTAADWLRTMPLEDWMIKRARPLSKELAPVPAEPVALPAVATDERSAPPVPDVLEILGEMAESTRGSDAA